MTTIDVVWSRIRAHEGQVFYQKRGAAFTYAVNGSLIDPSRTNQHISRKQIEEALRLVPLEQVAPLQHLRGPSYIYAILMDPRIRAVDW